jgi:UDP-N-acetylmuramoyl-L-alanyl-D-glutamate--2,6-diaminopimelate ligase
VSATRPLRPHRPRPQRLAELAGALGVPPAAADVAVSGVSLDSRAVCPGDLYAALPGSRAHGAAFTREAAAAGAAAVLTDPAGLPLAAAAGLPVLVAENPRAALGRLAALVYDDPSAALLVLGVTGTNGKTTTAYLLEHGLRQAGHRTGLIGTVETRIAGQAVPSVRTTPEAPDLQAAFAAMVERGVTAVAMEVSSHALAQGRVEGTRFAAGAFTNLSQDHLDYHGGMEEYFAAKALLFDGRCAHEVVNVDDPYGRRLVKPTTVTVSAAGDPAAAWRMSDLVAEPGGQRLRVHGPDGLDLPAAIRLRGPFNAANALLAVAALAAVGVDPSDAVKGIADTVVPGRMEPVDAGQPYTALVDYAHTPEAVTRLLAAVRAGTPARVIVVLGCGGDRDQAKRPLMGAAAARGSDLLVVTDDNPRSEPPADIRAAMLRGALDVPKGERGEVVEVGDRRQAIAVAAGRAAAGDALVVAGKGHEQGQEIAGAVFPFDDRAVLRDVIAGAFPPLGGQA